MLRAFYSRTLQQAGRLQLQLRSDAVRAEPALVRSAVTRGEIVPEYDSQYSTNSGTLSQRESSAHRPWGHLLPWAAAAISFGEASCAGDDDAELEEEVRSVRAVCLLQT
jgi:hypothetical protein